jgi:hypothetical protein
VNLSRWRAEAQHAEEDQGPLTDLHSDDEVDVSQQAGAPSARQNAPVSVNESQLSREQISTARVIDDVNDADIWAETENPQPTPVPAQERSQANNEQDDFEDWFALDDTLVPSSTSRKTPSVPDEEAMELREQFTSSITDEEIEALFTHTDEAMDGTVPRPSLPTEGDFEDMYN